MSEAHILQIEVHLGRWGHYIIPVEHWHNLHTKQGVHCVQQPTLAVAVTEVTAR